MFNNDGPIVTTTAGEVQGTRKEEGGVAVFKAVPYAAPPVGDRRWRPPAPLERWTGVRKATKDGPAALQRAAGFEEFLQLVVDGQGWNKVRSAATVAALKRAPKPKQSEDCLHLTVRTPDPSPQARLPVMVWIHGGDHQDGSSTELFYASNALAELGVVTVAINYRLGLLGYLAHPELSAESIDGVSGNYGTLDQIAALEWVRDNIAGFGGDPDNVTIFGESAGGESVLHLMISPLARGLFHRAIAQSPANGGQHTLLRTPFLDHPGAEARGEAFADALGLTGTGQLERLRERSADELYDLVRAATRLGDHYPTIDGHVIPTSPFAAFANGQQADVPMVIGSNANEGTLIQPLFGAPMAEYRYRPVPDDAVPVEMQQAFGDDLARLLPRYPGLESGEQAAQIDFLGDHMFGAPAHWYARHHATAGHPTWLYHFARTPASKKQTAGAFHAAEITFVHGSNVPILPMTEPDEALGASMRQHWTAMARTGDPNEGVDTGGPKWPGYTPTDPQWLRFDHEISAETVTKLDVYGVLDARLERVLRDMESAS